MESASGGKAQVRVTHRIRNTGFWPVELAPWAITVMATEGIAIVELGKRDIVRHPLVQRIISAYEEHRGRTRPD